MSDLISRQDAIDAALTFLVEYCGAAFDEDMQKMLCERLGALPSAEPEERTAKVKTVEKPNVFKCGECGQYFHSTSWGSPVVYCSRCGCRLEWK